LPLLKKFVGGEDTVLVTGLIPVTGFGALVAYVTFPFMLYDFASFTQSLVKHVS
jgi:hypothetical protein